MRWPCEQGCDHELDESDEESLIQMYQLCPIFRTRLTHHCQALPLEVQSARRTRMLTLGGTHLMMVSRANTCFEIRT